MPRYLYGTYSTSSQGRNEAPNFVSGAQMCGTLSTTTRLRHSPVKDIRLAISQHQLWHSNEPSPFISLTSSLMFALQLAIHRQDHLGKQDVTICVMDTRDLHHQDIFPVRALFEAYNVRWPVRAKRHCYETEYLVFGRLDAGHCTATTTLSDLQRLGLLDIYPEFHDAASKRFIGARVGQSRQLNFESPQLMTLPHLRVIERLARSFNGLCDRFLFLALSSLRRRHHKDSNLLFWATEVFHGMGLRDLLLIRSFLKFGRCWSPL